jgi:ferric-dicitrate binding protein FerR (iron transport regulator)
MNARITDTAAAGSKTYHTLAGQFAAAGEKDREQWLQLHAVMKKKFTDEQRKEMWAALDTGNLAVLPENQRAAMETWRSYAEEFGSPSDSNTDVTASGISGKERLRAFWAIAAVAALLLALGWAFRWQVVETQRGAYVINRWTGEVRYLLNGGSELVTPP